MGTFSGARLVEVGDAFDEDDFVGPPSTASASSSKSNELQSNNQKDGTLLPAKKPPPPPPSVATQQEPLITSAADLRASRPVVYTPTHPAAMKTPARNTRSSTATRRLTRGTAASISQASIAPVPAPASSSSLIRPAQQAQVPAHQHSAPAPIQKQHTRPPIILPPRRGTQTNTQAAQVPNQTTVTRPNQNVWNPPAFQNPPNQTTYSFLNGVQDLMRAPQPNTWNDPFLRPAMLSVPNVGAPSTSSSFSQPPAPAPAHSHPANSSPKPRGRPPKSYMNPSTSQQPRFPAPAHSDSLLPNTTMAPTQTLLSDRPPNMTVNRFNSQAIPVRTAYDDFLRQVTSALPPGWDVNEILKNMTNNPTTSGHVPVTANGALPLNMQQQVQNSLEANMLQALNSMRTAQAPSQNQFNTNIMDEIIYEQRKTLQQVQQKRPPPPSEDDMAKQDLDADVDQDDEFHEAETYSDYVPAKLKIGKPHPDPIVETSSLSTVEQPDIEYKLNLPAKVIDNGLLSALQLESVTYACQQHTRFLPDESTRRGFLIGDGAGVGKGRTIAGIIYENFLCGRKKSIWLSVSTDLKLDAERDLKDIGAKTIPVHLLGKFPYGRKINAEFGVIFTTYSGLVSKSQSVRGNLGTRLGQLIAWAGSNFDGVIVFDECHKAKNIAMGKNKKQQSKAAEFALEIQNKLPNARVVYASATGASETKHLGYMARLGIWGEGTPYRTFSEFCGAIEKRGVGAMELVAVDLKMRGSYIARQLSFKTTSFEIRIAELGDSFVSLYDQCVEMWAKALQYFSEAILMVAGNKKPTRTVWASFWAAHQKFFKYLCIGAKVPLVVKIAEEALKDKKCVVIGLQSTGEAKTLEALDDGDINEFISTARATFESLIENHFPAPYKPRRNRLQASRRVAETDSYNNPPSGSSNISAAPSTSGSSSSTIDERWHGHEAVKFVVEDGLVKAHLEEDKVKVKRSSSRSSNANEVDKKRFSKNQQVLDDLAREKRSKVRKVSGRAMRAKRRATERGQRKSRIRLLDNDSDTDISNPLSMSSGEQLNDSSIEGEDTDESYEYSESSAGNNDDDDDDLSSATVVGSESDLSTKVKSNRPSSAQSSKKKNVIESDSDSDIVITAIKPKRKNFEVIILSSDEDDLEDEELDDDDPMKVHGKKLTEMKDEMLDMIEKLGSKLPNNTLDDLIDRLGGPSKVAEMTGRKGRVVKDEDGQISYKQRNEADALDNLNIAEKERFMRGKKLIAIISEAASSGISLQADRRVENTKRRVHITIELPWSADRAIQQFGRTHRSNQLCGPEYVFIISELAGEKRFASIVAKRLESLGALTHGDRRATTDSRDLSQFNIASRYCKQALELMCRYLECETKFAGIEPDYSGNFIKDARDAFLGAGLARSSMHNIFIPEPAALQINHFLNRLLGMKVGIQNSLFKLFTDYMDRLILRKKVAGLYDAGILELNSESGKTRCGNPEDFYLKTKSGTVKCTLWNVQVERGISWEAAKERLENAPADSRNGFYTSTNPLTKAKMVLLVVREPQAVDLFRAYKPNTGRQPKPAFFSFLTERTEKTTLKTAEKIWRLVYTETDTKCVHLCFFKSCKRMDAKMKCDVGLRHRNYCILSGGILTAWPYLESKAPGVTTRLQIVRLKLDSSRVIGPIIPQDAVEHVRRVLKKGEESGVEF